VKHIPFFKFLAILQILLLARRHLQGLSRAERRRMAELVRHGHRLSKAERHELRMLASKLEAGAFVRGAAVRASPLRLKKNRV
jgi:hypothetical protein